jgi:hypothetical protein
VKWSALVVGICALTGARAPAAQVTATVDAGLSVVRYDGFLASAAASITPSVRWEAGGAFVRIRGTYLRFESGNRSLDGDVTAAWLKTLGGRWRGEIAAAAGASEYADIARFGHGIAEGRVHLVNGRSGAWLGGGAGSASFGRGQRPVAVAAIGAWALRDNMTYLASIGRSWIGDTAYTDLRASGRTRRGPVVLELGVGARFWSRGAGRGVYGEGSATLDLSRQFALVVSGGRYPTDAISGSIAGRYLAVAGRIGIPGARPHRLVARPLPLPITSPDPGAPRLEVGEETAGTLRLIIHAPAARSVEIMGTFTEWQPVALGSPAAGTWTIVLPIARGLHRINVRLDGGPWLAPAGTTRATDDYGGAVGTFVVP